MKLASSIVAPTSESSRLALDVVATVLWALKMLAFGGILLDCVASDDPLEAAKYEEFNKKISVCRNISKSKKQIYLLLVSLSFI